MDEEVLPVYRRRVRIITASGVISFNSQDNFVHQLVQGKEIFQTIPEWAWFSQGDGRKGKTM